MLSNDAVRVPAKLLLRIAACLILIPSLAAIGAAQDQQQDKSQDNSKARQESVEVIHLTHGTQSSSTEILTALRNVLSTKFRAYLDNSHAAIVVRGTTDEIEQAHKLIAELDRPAPLYKLTFTITQIEDGKRTGTKKYTLLAADGKKVVLKQGDKVPVLTGQFDSDKSASQSQFQYIDTGLGIEATYEGSTLKAKLEETAVSGTQSIAGVQEPVIKQTSLESTTTEMPGKSDIIGSFDVPDSTKHQEVEVLVERMQ